ncbi:MAG TPA: HAD-IA family hydrolase [Burkholderiales bacterium]|nr:HAD-IA family hydrolase [Burkholderiales bacterium]
MKPRALIFDVDGTLADTEEAHRRAFNAAFLAHGLAWEWSPSLYGDLLGVTGGKERIGKYLESLPVPEAEKASLRRLVPLVHSTKTRLFAEFVEMGNVPLRPGVARLIAEARAAAVPLGIASTTTPANVNTLLTRALGLGALSWFGAIATGDVVANKKPAPDIYRLALGTLRLPADGCVAIEDSALGVRAAKAAGLYTVAVPTRWTVAQDLSVADLVLPSLGDLQHPLDAAAAARIGGATMLGLAQLGALLATV